MKKENKDKIIIGTLGGILIGTIANGVIQVVFNNRRNKKLEEIENSLALVLESNNKLNEIGIDQTKILQTKLLNLSEQIKIIEDELVILKDNDIENYNKISDKLEVFKQDVLKDLKDLRTNLKNQKGGNNKNGKQP